MPDCPIHAVQRLVGGKWSLVILWHLRDGARRFAELERGIGQVSQKVLTENLRAMERDSLLTRTVHAGVPPAVEYQLTPLGRTLLPIVEAIERWAVEHRGDLAPPASAAG